jgi:hypothetical protein
MTKRGKEVYVAIGDRELETAECTFTKTGVSLAVNDVEVFDPQYLTVPKEFERLHKELRKIIKDARDIERFYNYMLAADSIRKKHFSDHGILPYYLISLVTNALIEHNACVFQNGMLKKKEIFTRFLIYRNEVIAEATGEVAIGKHAVKDLDQILSEEEKAERKYRLPASNELKEMNYEMLTLEMAKAEEMMAKPKFIKILKEMRLAKAPAKNRKTELQRMKDVIQEEKIDQEEQVPQTRLAKHQQRKAEKQRQEKIRYEQPAKTQPKIKIAKAEDAEYVE